MDRALPRGHARRASTRDDDRRGARAEPDILMGYKGKGRKMENGSCNFYVLMQSKDQILTFSGSFFAFAFAFYSTFVCTKRSANNFFWLHSFVFGAIELYAFVFRTVKWDFRGNADDMRLEWGCGLLDCRDQSRHFLLASLDHLK